MHTGVDDPFVDEQPKDLTVINHCYFWNLGYITSGARFFLEDYKRRCTGRMILIISDRVTNLEVLRDEIKLCSDKLAAVFVYGEDGRRVHKELALVLDMIVTLPTVQQCLEHAYTWNIQNCQVLLAPCAPAMPEYHNSSNRTEDFERMIRAYKKSKITG